MPEKYIAEVKNNVDPDKEGKVQIYIPHLMHGFKAADYPWAYQDREWTSDIPEIRDFVWVWFEDEKFFKKPFYQNKLAMTSGDHVDFEDSIKSKISSEVSYPDMKYMYTKAGVCIGLSAATGTPELVIYHPKAYIHINKLGEFKYKDDAGNQIDIKATDMTFKDKNNNTLTFVGTAININNNLVVDQ